MFYCDECAKQRDWPNWMGFMSHGLCEVCGKERDCYDLPARLLPIPPAQRTARGRGLDLNRKPLSGQTGSRIRRAAEDTARRITG